MVKFRQIARRQALSPADFVRQHLVANLPVVVTDAMQGWPAFSRWSLQHLSEHFGDRTVVVHGHTFMDVGDPWKLSDYIDFVLRSADIPDEEAFGKAQVPYLRRFPREIFELSTEEWSRPYFLPDMYYLQPAVKDAHPQRGTPWPDFGVYVSPKGACTALHVDAWRNDNVLCQFSGTKRCFLIPPQYERHLEDVGCAKPQDIWEGDPSYPGADEVFETELRGGETLVIPAGWVHEVYTTSPSISLTFNYTHFATAERFLQDGISHIGDALRTMPRNLAIAFSQGLLMQADAQLRFIETELAQAPEEKLAEYGLAGVSRQELCESIALPLGNARRLVVEWLADSPHSA